MSPYSHFIFMYLMMMLIAVFFFRSSPLARLCSRSYVCIYYITIAPVPLLGLIIPLYFWCFLNHSFCSMVVRLSCWNVF